MQNQILKKPATYAQCQLVFDSKMGEYQKNARIFTALYYKAFPECSIRVQTTDDGRIWSSILFNIHEGQDEIEPSEGECLYIKADDRSDGQHMPEKLLLINEGTVRMASKDKTEGFILNKSYLAFNQSYYKSFEDLKNKFLRGVKTIMDLMPDLSVKKVVLDFVTEIMPEELRTELVEDQALVNTFPHKGVLKAVDIKKYYLLEDGTIMRYYVTREEEADFLPEVYKPLFCEMPDRISPKSFLINIDCIINIKNDKSYHEIEQALDVAYQHSIETQQYLRSK